MLLLEPHNLPFAVALALMVLLLVLQLIGVGDGEVDADTGGEADFDLSGGGVLDAVTTLLGLGRVPLFVWLMVFLLLFSTVGLGIQALAADLTGSPLYTLLAAVLAGGASLPLTAGLVRPLGRIMPGDESTAVGIDALLGKRAQITTGRATAGYPARARVVDHHGHAHHVMVEPHEAGDQLAEGDQVLLVRREGETFYAIPLGDRVLAPVE
jgi:Protein of unknown function (DUF1449)